MVEQARMMLPLAGVCQELTIGHPDRFYKLHHETDCCGDNDVHGELQLEQTPSVPANHK